AGVENVDASGREYFEFYVDISEVSPDAPFAIVFRMRNADGSKEYMSPSVGAGDAMQLIDANGVTEATLDDYGRIVLPAGFAGYVRMAVATFAADGLDMTAVASMVIWYGATDNEIGKTIYFNDFRFGGTATPPDDGGDDNEDDPSTDVPVVYPVQGTTPENGGEILFGNANSETGISSLTPGVTGLAVVETETGKIIQMMNTVLASDVSIAIDAPQGTSWDASEMDYFEFWVDASEMPANFPLAIGEDEYMACFGMILRVKDADGRAADSLCLGNYGPIFHQDAEGNWVESKVSEYGHIWVPAGYSGYIRISLAELGEVDSLSPYDGNGDGLPLDLSKLTHIRFWYTAQADKADTPEDESTLEKSVYFNDFKFVKGVADGDDNTGDDNTGDDNTGDDNTGADDEDNKAPDTGAVIPVAAFGLVALGAAGMVFSRKRK
ncbi:MAG: hypothetical protein IJY82_07355, partial [Oscillospiraceae bacterium]|nr:hypothetical protein [Oscillospiraceae bacterium]